MKQNYYPQLDETVIWDELPNGLTIAVVPKKGFQKKLAYFVTDYGSIHTHFKVDGEAVEAPAGVAVSGISLSAKQLTPFFSQADFSSKL